MKKTLLIILWLAVIAGAYFFFMQWPSREKIVFAGNYQSFESGSGTINSDKITVLDFYAPRCPSCRTAHKNIINEISQLPNNLQILNVDYDTNKELREKYGVTSQHTFVLVDRNGNKLKSIQWLNHVSEIVDFVWSDLLNPVVPVIETGDAQTGNTEVIGNDNEVSTVQPATTTSAQQDIAKEESTQSAGLYTDYESGKKFISDSSKKVVLFFHASRCPNCRQAESDILKNKNDIDSDLVILKVDYDNSSDLKQQYGITSQTSYVLLNNDGSLNKKLVGMTSLEAIENFIK